MFSLSAYYDLFSQFDLSKKSSGGSKVSYTDASGFSVALKYNWRPTWAWVLNFSQLKYSERKSGATKVDLSANPVTYTLYGCRPSVPFLVVDSGAPSYLHGSLASGFRPVLRS